MIDREQLAEAVGQLDAGTRALLDLSLRRAIPDDQVAGVLGVEAASIPPRRARGIAQLADALDVPGPSELAALLLAIPELPESAWGVPEVAPFTGSPISRARRAKAFRRLAVAASPLVAAGAVMAAILVSSDHGGHATSAGSTANAGGAGSGSGASISAPAPEARHGLPPGVQLTLAHRGSRAAHAHHAARHQHAHRRLHGAPERAILTRQPAASPRTEPVVFHPAPAPSPVTQPAPQPPRHHHPAPHVPHTSPAPAPNVNPAPVTPPSVPVDNSPAPQTQNAPNLSISAPSTQNPPSPAPTKPSKPSVPQPTGLNPPGNGGDDGGEHSGCDGSQHFGNRGDGNNQGDHSERGDGGRGFTPPGLFRRRYSGGH